MSEHVKLTPEEALAKMREAERMDDNEVAHGLADDLLCAVLRYYGQDELVEVYNSVGKWYA